MPRKATGPFIISLCFLPRAFAMDVLIFILEFELILKLNYRDALGEPIIKGQPLRAAMIASFPRNG